MHYQMITEEILAHWRRTTVSLHFILQLYLYDFKNPNIPYTVSQQDAFIYKVSIYLAEYCHTLPNFFFVSYGFIVSNVRQ